MTRTMRAFARRIAVLAAAVVGAPLSQIARPWGDWALADHGGALRSAPMSPLLVGLIAGALALAAGAIVLVIVRLLTRKAPPSG
jgi:hypothetical protein